MSEESKVLLTAVACMAVIALAGMSAIWAIGRGTGELECLLLQQEAAR